MPDGLRGPLLGKRSRTIRKLGRAVRPLDDRSGGAQHAIRERGSLDPFHHERADAVRVFEAVDVGDVRMIERRQQLRLAAEPHQPIRIVRDGWQQDLDRDITIQLRIVGPIHLAHPARSKGREDFVRTETGAGSQGQPYRLSFTTKIVSN